VLSLLKGSAYAEALVLLVMLLALLPCRREFYRKASLFDERYTPEWLTAIALVTIGTVWLLLLSYKHVEYSHDLWWQFEFARNAPRSLRASIGALVLLVSFGVARLLRTAPPEPADATEADLELVRNLVTRSPRTSAHLALLGDKRFLFDEESRGFVMYATSGRSWIAMGDPVGERAAAHRLGWRFRELNDRHGGWTVFYEVGPRYLPLYLDLGLGLLKLGEEARVSLPHFELEGGERKAIRQPYKRILREGCTFDILFGERVEAILSQLRAISDAWLARKNTREKGFSLGFFSPAYLSQLPVAVVRREGAIIAFANLWLGAEKEELSVDLMRYAPSAPSGIMDFLFTELLLWGKAEGYRWFNLGMAPLSGYESRALAPLSSRLGAFVFRHGEHFYNFQGLRQYKAKFDPVWEPRYLASPGGLALPRILANVAALISGGLRGVIAR
jgi:phosphatidylglycerol lysyltransferase